MSALEQGSVGAAKSEPGEIHDDAAAETPAGASSPALKNSRHERFAQAIAIGETAATAYITAGYAQKGPAAQKAAASLRDNPEIARRIAEISGRGAISERDAAPAEISVASLIRELEEARQIAIENKQPAPAVSATMAKAKLAGLISEKPESKPETTLRGGYTEAARRIAFILSLAANEAPDEDKH